MGAPIDQGCVLVLVLGWSLVGDYQSGPLCPVQKRVAPPPYGNPPERG